MFSLMKIVIFLHLSLHKGKCIKAQSQNLINAWNQKYLLSKVDVAILDGEFWSSLSVSTTSTFEEYSDNLFMPYIFFMP